MRYVVSCEYSKIKEIIQKTNLRRMTKEIRQIYFRINEQYKFVDTETKRAFDRLRDQCSSIIKNENTRCNKLLEQYEKEIVSAYLSLEKKKIRSIQKNTGIISFFKSDTQKAYEIRKLEDKFLVEINKIESKNIDNAKKLAKEYSNIIKNVEKMRKDKIKKIINAYNLKISKKQVELEQDLSISDMIIMAGKRGEDAVKHMLSFMELPGDNCLFNQKISIAGIIQEYDCILFTMKGIISIEVKGYGLSHDKRKNDDDAELLIDKDNQWILTKNGRKKSVENPYYQSMRHNMCLCKCLPKKNIINVILLANTHLLVQDESTTKDNNVNIVKIDSFYQFYNSLEEKMSLEDIAKYKETLADYYIK